MSYFGKYRAEVVDIQDPESRGRIRVKCPKVLGEQVSRWALPCFPPNTFTLPQKGELVWVEFEDGSRDMPIWTGVFYTREQMSNKFNKEASGSNYILATKGVISINASTLTKIGKLETLGVKVVGNLMATGQITDVDGDVHKH